MTKIVAEREMVMLPKEEYRILQEVYKTVKRQNLLLRRLEEAEKKLKAGKTKASTSDLKKAFQGINIKELARDLKVSNKYVYNVKNGEKKVSARRAKLLEKMTGGKLSRKVLRPDIFLDQ